jgi:hypothetical protein
MGAFILVGVRTPSRTWPPMKDAPSGVYLKNNVTNSVTQSTASKHPAWKGKLLHWSGRLTLVRTTLSAIPIYTTISIDKALWKIMTAFLWSGTEVV